MNPDVIRVMLQRLKKYDAMLVNASTKHKKIEQELVAIH